MTMITWRILCMPVRPASDVAAGAAGGPATWTDEVQAASVPASRPQAAVRQMTRRWLRMTRNLRGEAWAARQVMVRAPQRKLGIFQARPRCYSGGKSLSSWYGRTAVDRGWRGRRPARCAACPGTVAAAAGLVACPQI